MSKRTQPRQSGVDGVLKAPGKFHTIANTAPAATTRNSIDTAELENAIASLPIGQLSIHDAGIREDAGVSGAPKTIQDKAASRARSRVPFRFLELPSELRIKIYAFHFSDVDTVIDLDPSNYKLIHRKLAFLRVSRTVYLEASHYFYSTRIVRVFPTYPGRFFKSKRPLLARLSKRQHAHVSRLELRLGPGFDKPPRGWVVNGALGLKECVNAWKLSVFVQLDPSLSWLDGFRRSGFYEEFSRNLLHDILSEATGIEEIEFDGEENVKRDCPIMKLLIKTALDHNKRITWGTRMAAETQVVKAQTVEEGRPVSTTAFPSRSGTVATLA